MRRALLLPVLAASLAAVSPAWADDFAAVAARAERLDALEPFLARYVGRCTDVYEKRTCEANVAAARRAVAGRTFAVRIADAAQLVRPKLEGDRFLLLVTPFFDGNGLALTNGAPARQDAAGHPLVDLIPIRGSLKPGTMEMEFQSPFRTGAIEIEVVFRPERAWKLPRKGEPGNLEGVAARLLAIRVLDARTGSEIAAKVL